MAVLGKFYVRSVLTDTGGQLHPDNPQAPVTVRLEAVYGGPEDNPHPNSQWARFTPSGEIEMVITNPDASDYFVPGEEYMVRFTRAQPQKARS